MDAHPPIIPRPPTQLLGRAADLARVAALLRQPDAQLVTITGPGGVGKTRLALEVARRDGAFGERVYWCALAPLPAASEALASIGQLFGIADTANLAALLRSQLRAPTLLILDNAEHLPDLSPALAVLLEAAPALVLLVTSRAPLRLRAERVVALPPLPVPDGADLSPEALLAIPSVALVLERARAVQPAFQLSPLNAGAVATLCARLDGLPLALELAAARLATFSPQAIVERLAQQLDLLAHDALDRPARQQTLRQTVAWSVRLLSAQARRVFAALAAFAGGWTLAAAEAICAEGGSPAPATLAALDELVRHSLVQRHEGADGEPRYGLLETIHAYARELLADLGDGPHARHAAYFLGLAEAADAARAGSDQARWLATLAAEQANLERALAWYQAQGSRAHALRLAGALGWYWIALDHLPAGRAWLERLLEGGEATAGDEPARARALHMLGTIARHQGAYGPAAEAYTASLALWEGLGGFGEASDVACGLAEVAYRRDDRTAAEAAFTRALQHSRAAGDQRRLAAALSGIARIRWAAGDERAAAAMQAEALGLHESLDNAYGAAWSRCALGEIARGQGRFSLAARHFAASIAGFAALGQRGPRALALQNLAFVWLAQGEAERAADAFTETLALWRAGGASHGIALSLIGLAGVALEREEPRRAAGLLGAVEPHLATIGMHLERTDAADHARIVRRLQATLPEDQSAAARASGRATRLEELLNAPLSPLAEAAASLTERERSVLHLVALGRGNKQIAEQLALSPQTVAVHLRAIYRKLAVHSRTAAVAAARRSGLLPPELP
jgi:predicted ATPase/DNA-binding CsgD family transcriptional regulator